MSRFASFSFQKYLEAIAESQWVLQLPVFHIFCFSNIEANEFIGNPANATRLLSAHRDWDLSHEREFLTDDFFAALREKRENDDTKSVTIDGNM